MNVKFSFVIPTFNEGDYLKPCLDSIKSQKKTNYEIIIVDSFSNDCTAEIAKKYKCRLFFVPKVGPGLARNAGMKKAGGEIIIFADADTRFENDFLDKLDTECNGNISGGICKLAVYDPRGGMDIIFYKSVNYLVRFLIRIGLVITAGSCFIYKKDVLKKTGGFNTRFITNEDHDLAKRANKLKRFKFFKDVVVYTSCRRVSSMGELKTIKTYLKSTLFFYLKNSYLKDYWS